jgi:thiol-disulfide isomerase/thioredoxin
MKRILLPVILYIALFSGCKTHKPIAGNKVEPPSSTLAATGNTDHAMNYSDQSTWLLGYFNLSQLKSEPHSVWFYKGYDEYHPDAESMKKLEGEKKDGLTISVVMGTWCPDSRREVPRFMKILDSWQFPADKVTFIGVDNAKLSPIGGYDQLEIHRVPTFIICRNNVEAGRIIENPVTSLEQDMVNILRGMNNNK